jgi:glycosyltransferase involved in cell wall biosynthesis
MRVATPPTEEPPIELTVLMPCLNEALTLATCIDKARWFLDQAGIVGEVLIADNGSTDDSIEIALAHGAQVLNVRQRGYGAALMAGIRAARGRYVVMGDSDDSYDFSRLQGFIAALRQGHQLVMGNRFAGGISPGAMPALHRYLGNPVLSFVGRLFYRSPIHDFHCGLRGFERAAILRLELNSTGMEFASEMIVKATLAGLQITEVPTTLQPDGRDRPPHLRSWRDGWRHLRFLLVHAPAWLFMFPGLALLVTGLGLAVPLSMGPLPMGSFTLDIHTLLYAAVTACVGLQMLLFAGLSSSHAVQIGVLPAMPTGLAWARTVSLEKGLLVGLALILGGAGLALGTVWMWSGADFQAVNPSRLMRVAIPAAAMVLAGTQVATTAFLMEYVRLIPRKGSTGA